VWLVYCVQGGGLFGSLFGGKQQQQQQEPVCQPAMCTPNSNVHSMPGTSTPVAVLQQLPRNNSTVAHMKADSSKQQRVGLGGENTEALRVHETPNQSF
jgi:hypothetical protein